MPSEQLKCAAHGSRDAHTFICPVCYCEKEVSFELYDDAVIRLEGANQQLRVALRNLAALPTETRSWWRNIHICAVS